MERFHDRGFPAIEFAGRDAVELGRFFVERCKGDFGLQQIDLQALGKGEIAAGQADAVFEDLEARLHRDPGGLGRGDSIFVALESHFLDFDGARSLIVTSDAARGGGPAPAPSLSAERVAQTLEQLSSYGCTVMLLLDGVHDPGPRGMKERNRLNEWVRQLSRGGVIVLVASNSGPSRRDKDARLGVLTRPARLRRRPRPLRPGATRCPIDAGRLRIVRPEPGREVQRPEAIRRLLRPEDDQSNGPPSSPAPPREAAPGPKGTCGPRPAPTSPAPPSLRAVEARPGIPWPSPEPSVYAWPDFLARVPPLPGLAGHAVANGHRTSLRPLAKNPLRDPLRERLGF